MSDRDAVPAGRTWPCSLFLRPLAPPSRALSPPARSSVPLPPGAVLGPAGCSPARPRRRARVPSPGPPPSCTRSADTLIPDSLAACHLHDQTDTV